MKENTQKNIKIMAEIAIFAAISYVLDALQGGILRGVFPNGGSVGFAMLPILVIAYKRGFLSGFICGLTMSFLQLLGGFYAIADSWYLVILQILLDYILAYPFVAFAGVLFKKFQTKRKYSYLVYGSILGGVMKFMCHFLAGFIFWSYNTPSGFIGGPVVYSMVYNGSYMVPNIIINTLVLLLIYKKLPKLLVTEKLMFEVEEVENKPKYKLFILKLSIGLIIFIASLLFFTFSYEFYQDSYGKDISFNEDSVPLMLAGLIIIGYSFLSLKNNSSKYLYLTGILVSFIFSSYSLGVFFKSLNKDIPYTDVDFYLYIAIASVIILGFMLFFFIRKIKENKYKK